MVGTPCGPVGHVWGSKSDSKATRRRELQPVIAEERSAGHRPKKYLSSKQPAI